MTDRFPAVRQAAGRLALPRPCDYATEAPRRQGGTTKERRSPLVGEGRSRRLRPDESSRGSGVFSPYPGGSCARKA